MSDVKLIRKQLHNVLESHPELLKTEIYKTAFDQLRTDISLRLKAIEGDIKKSLTQMEERQKDVHSMITRAAFATPTQAVEEAPTPEPQQPAETAQEGAKAEGQ